MQYLYLYIYKLNIKNIDKVFMEYVCRAGESRVNGGQVYLPSDQGEIIIILKCKF